MIGIATFFLIAFGIPWAGWLLVRDENMSLWLFPLFASIAGFSAAYAEGGKEGLKVFSRRVFAIAPSVPYVLAGVALPLLLGLSYLLTKGVPLFSMPWSPAAVLALSLGAALVTGPIAEEFGWRGYLQHRLLNRFAPFWTALIVGAIWWVWHFALYRASVFASPVSAFNFFAYLVTWSLFMVFLVESGGGSVWPAVALHWAANTHPSVLQSLQPYVDGGILPGGSKGSLFYLGAACAFAAINHRFFFAKRASGSVSHATADNSFKPKPLRGSA
ncbi:type II CAAX endopeptidase family protein [Lysobacter sp. M15]|uniref:CPBP family intramembrane glutamic endopeptidase n=1 Tax=Lysobacter sp. M15 TaxID=2916837 RepID=UPI001F5913A4|nr:type II CAAX endopeptidase family protein [Lysobacter sp. M15]